MEEGVKITKATQLAIESMLVQHTQFCVVAMESVMVECVSFMRETMAAMRKFTEDNLKKETNPNDSNQQPDHEG